MDAQARAQISRAAVADVGHGFDAFGASTPWVRRAARLGWPLYRHYFRVDSRGSEHVPEDGPAILVANHSGTLPFDAAMLYLDVLLHGGRTRPPRPIADFFVPAMPFVGTLFARVGVVGGARLNAERLIEDGELLMIFPEGTRGIGKDFRDRYQLQQWNVGHAELAIRHRAPIVPVGIVGAEEQWPQLARLPVPKWLGIPWIPLVATPLPLPAHYHLRYGAPIRLHERWAPEQADDPQIVARGAAEVRAAVQELLAQGLRERRGVFR